MPAGDVLTNVDRSHSREEVERKLAVTRSPAESIGCATAEGTPTPEAECSSTGRLVVGVERERNLPLLYSIPTSDRSYSWQDQEGCQEEEAYDDSPHGCRIALMRMTLPGFDKAYHGGAPAVSLHLYLSLRRIVPHGPRWMAQGRLSSQAKDNMDNE